MASTYYEAFEGIHLYPKLRNKLGFFWLLSLLLVVIAIVALFKGISYSEPFFYFSAFTFMGTSAAAEDFRVKSITAQLGRDHRVARIQRLEQITGRPASQFQALAQEAAQLLALQEQFTPRRFSVRTMLYNASMKGQLLPIFIGLVSIFLIVFQKTFSLESEQFFELFESPGIWGIAAYGLFFLLLAFFVAAGILYIYYEFSGIFRRWRAKAGIHKPSARVELDYFLRHLIVYHDPVRTVEHHSNTTLPHAAKAGQRRKLMKMPRQHRRGTRSI